MTGGTLITLTWKPPWPYTSWKPCPASDGTTGQSEESTMSCSPATQSTETKPKPFPRCERCRDSRGPCGYVWAVHGTVPGTLEAVLVSSDCCHVLSTRRLGSPRARHQQSRCLMTSWITDSHFPCPHMAEGVRQLSRVACKGTPFMRALPNT